MVRAVAEVDYWISSKLNHSAAPAILRTIYAKIK